MDATALARIHAPREPIGEEPVQIGERVWWVGHRQENDPFQCHVYLIEQGDQSVLIDPGSNRTIQHTLRKIEQIIPFSNIRYFVCQHPDPDITASLPLLDSMVTRPDAVIVSHWRAGELLDHFATRMPLWLVEGHGWTLELADRTLDFIFTPYAHFPGAFCTFDRRTGILFSSDLYGGFTEEFALYARDLSCFDGIRAFHEHYMPSREILDHALRKLMAKPVRLIAPQHGSIIPGNLIKPVTDKLAALECGLYLLARDHSDIQRLSQVNATLRDLMQTMLLYRDFREIATRILGISQRLLPATSLEFYAQLEDSGVLHLAPATGYRGTIGPPPATFATWLGSRREAWKEARAEPFAVLALPDSPRVLAVPLFAPVDGRMQAFALFHLSEELTALSDVSRLVDEMALPLEVAVERERIYRGIELERERLYQRSIRDPLTGLFTRLYMNDMVQHLMELQDRDDHARVGVLMCDIDHFKAVNDTYGHGQGDVVLTTVAQALTRAIRVADLPVRMGGEEFAVFVSGPQALDLSTLAERLRAGIAALEFDGAMAGKQVTVSVGTATRRQGETLAELLARADTALYAAKRAGRNRVCVARPALAVVPSSDGASQSNRRPRKGVEGNAGISRHGVSRLRPGA